MARHRRGMGAVAVCVLALVVAGCGSAASPSATGVAQSKVGASVITRAADLSGAEQGDTAIATFVTSVNGHPFTILVRGSVDRHPRTGQATMTILDPHLRRLQPSFTSLKVSIITIDGEEYLHVPAILAAPLKLPAGRSWVELSGAQLDEHAVGDGTPGIGSLLSGSSGSSSDPSAILGELEAATPGSVTRVGTDVIRGVSTTHYHLSLSTEDRSRALPSAVRARLAALAKAVGAETIPVDVWIGADGLVRQIRESYRLKQATGGTARVTGLIDITGYGPQPAPKAPPAAQIDNLNSPPGSTSPAHTLFG